MQKMRYSDKELLLIKGVFSENEDLFKSMRKIFYQMPLTAIDLGRFQVSLKSKELLAILRKMFLPILDSELPLQQNIDLMMTIKLNEMPVSEGAVHLKSIKIWIDYMNQQLKVIESGKYAVKSPKINFNKLTDLKDKTDWDMYTDVLARNTIINHTEQCLRQLLILAGKKDETPEQTVERLSKDSNK
jgi:hypothetical protein